VGEETLAGRGAILGTVDPLQFVASLLQSLSWPVAVVVVSLLFRRELTALLTRLRTVKVPGGEATFGEQLASAEATVDAFKDSAPEVVAAEDDRPPEQAPVTTDPSGLVLSSWEALSEALFALRRATAGRGRPSSQVGVVLRQLADEGIVNDLFVRSVEQLRELRNEVAHARAIPTPGAARNYADQARELSRAAEVLAGHRQT
jgi:hypothetical protein